MRTSLKSLLLLTFIPLTVFATLSEGLMRDFGQTKWKELRHSEDATGMIYEYIPANQQNGPSSEKVTIQIYPGKNFSLPDFVKQFHTLMQQHKDGKYEYILLSNKPDEKIIEWTITKDNHIDMGGWVRVLKDDKALKAITVEVRNPSDFPTQRTHWLQEIKSYDFNPRA